MPTLNELLAPQVIFKRVVNRIKPVNDTLQRFWGLQMGTGNVEDIPGRAGSYDIYDMVRTAASFRSPSAGPFRRSAYPVSQQPVTCARIYQSVPLMYDRIFPLRKLGGPSSDVDKGGADYIMRQETNLKHEMNNSREFLVAGMMRGSCQFLVSGDNWTPVFSGGTYTVSFQIPTGNTLQLNMTGGGNIITTSWADTVNAQIFENVLAVDSAFNQLHGWPLKHIWVNSVLWGQVTNNAGLKARSGTSNMIISDTKQPWDLGQVNRTEFTIDDYKAQIKCLPGITWHIYNGGLTLNGTFTKFIPDTMAIFCPEPDDNMVAAIRGSEYIQENEMQPAVERRGPYFYPVYYREPARIELTGWDSWMCALRLPKTIAPATTVF